MKTISVAFCSGLIAVMVLFTGGNFFPAHADSPLVGEKTLIGDNAGNPAAGVGDGRFLVVWESFSSASSNIQGAFVTEMSDQITPEDTIILGVQKICRPDDPRDCMYPAQMHPAMGFDPVNSEFWVLWADNRDGFLEGAEHSWSIYGTRVDPLGEYMVVYDFPMEESADEQSYPAVSPNADLFVWQDSCHSPNEPHIVGWIKLLDEFPISPYEDGDEVEPAVGFDGTDYLVAWKFFDNAGENSGIYGQIAGGDGELIGEPFLIFSKLCNRIDIAFDGTNYLVVWDSSIGGNRLILCQLVSPAGALVGSRTVFSGGTNMYYPAVAFDGLNYLVVWEWRTLDQNRGIWGQWISTDGERLGEKFQIEAFDTGTSAGNGPDLAFLAQVDTRRYLVVWEESPHRKVYGRLIAPRKPRLTLSAGPANPREQITPAVAGNLGVTHLNLSLDHSAPAPAEISAMTFTFAGNGDLNDILSAGLYRDTTCQGISEDLIGTAVFNGNAVTVDSLTETIAPGADTCFLLKYEFGQASPPCPCSVYGADIRPEDILVTIPDGQLETAGETVNGSVQADYPETELIGDNRRKAKRNKILPDPLSVRLTHGLDTDCRTGWQVRFAIDGIPDGAAGQILGCGGPECVVPFDDAGEARIAFTSGDINGTYDITAVCEPSPGNPYACPPRAIAPLVFHVDVECYLLTLATTPQGTGSVGTSPLDTCYDPGRAVTLTALPNAGSVFDHWEGHLSGNVNPGIITMNEDKQVTAVFASGSSPLDADFSAEPLGGPPTMEVRFTDLSTGVITGWLWDFGDGMTSTARHPVHVYNATGTYTVGLTVAGPGGADTETRTDMITVFIIPGDIDNDGNVTLMDVICSLQISSGHDMNGKPVNPAASIEASHRIGMPEAIYAIQKLADMR